MAITTVQRKVLINILRASARREILPRYRKLADGSVQSKSSPSDLVTIADKMSEQHIKNAIFENFSDMEVIGEEAVAENPSLLARIGLADKIAIIDPIDGTWNYAKGLPLFGVILAVVEHSQTTFGALYDPVMDDVMFAHRGEGAFFQVADTTPKPIQIGSANPLSLSSGFLPLFLFDNELQKELQKELSRFARVLSFRCSSHEYRLMSEGAVDFLISGFLKPWDHAAGELIYREAGGYAAMLPDMKAYSPTMTNGQLLLAPDKATWLELREVFDCLSGNDRTEQLIPQKIQTLEKGND